MRSTLQCKHCSRKGKNNGFFGKKHSTTSKAKVSKNRIGKGVGENNSMAKAEHRAKVSSQLKKKYASGDLDFLREIQRKNATANQANGKLATAPVSKEEKQLKAALEAHGLVVESQFRIGSLKYDLMIPDRKVIVEFHDDYWHCNPKQYAPDYVNKKKLLYAHEIWAHDARKKSAAESAGYRVICVWDSEYKKNKNYITELIDAIKD
jgi:G:T-mismatch repair DNA endonuclease (very short patch repair protein)